MSLPTIPQPSMWGPRGIMERGDHRWGGVLLSAIWYTVRFFSMLGTGGGGGCCSYSVGKGFA